MSFKVPVPRFDLTVSCERSARAIVAKMALDQLLLSPIGICIFYTIIKTMEGERTRSLCH